MILSNFIVGHNFPEEDIKAILTLRRKLFKKTCEGKTEGSAYQSLPYSIYQFKDDYSNAKFSVTNPTIYGMETKKSEGDTLGFFRGRKVQNIIVHNGERYAEISQTRRLAVKLEKNIVDEILKELELTVW